MSSLISITIEPWLRRNNNFFTLKRASKTRKSGIEEQRKKQKFPVKLNKISLRYCRVQSIKSINHYNRVIVKRRRGIGDEIDFRGDWTSRKDRSTRRRNTVTIFHRARESKIRVSFASLSPTNAVLDVYLRPVQNVWSDSGHILPVVCLHRFGQCFSFDRSIETSRDNFN